MTTPSALVVGGSIAGCLTALVLADHGIETTLVDRASHWSIGDDDLSASEALFGAVGLGGPSDVASLVSLLRERGIESRLGAEVLGLSPVDAHVEVELSAGPIENHDVVVVTAVTPQLRAHSEQVPAPDPAGHPRVVFVDAGQEAGALADDAAQRWMRALDAASRIAHGGTVRP